MGTSIALVGPGAIGATVAAYLHAAGHPVLLCGHTPRESIEVRLGDGVIDEIVDLLAQAPPDITTSMLTDREASRPLEWDIRNGVIVRKAAAHGLATPISEIVVPLLAAASDGPG